MINPELTKFWAKRFSEITTLPMFKTFMVLLHQKHGDKTESILEEIKNSPMAEVLREINFKDTPQGEYMWLILLNHCVQHSL